MFVENSISYLPKSHKYSMLKILDLRKLLRGWSKSIKNCGVLEPIETTWTKQKSYPK